MTDGKESARQPQLMRQVVPLALLLILIACTSATTEPVTSETTTEPTDGGKESVVMENVAFRPDEVTVAVGTTVTWTNQDLVAHTTTSEDDLWDSERMGQSESFSFTFEEPGTFTYICTIHPAQMQGTITVEG
jgi:plastocyanin